MRRALLDAHWPQIRPVARLSVMPFSLAHSEAWDALPRATDHYADFLSPGTCDEKQDCVGTRCKCSQGVRPVERGL